MKLIPEHINNWTNPVYLYVLMLAGPAQRISDRHRYIINIWVEWEFEKETRKIPHKKMRWEDFSGSKDKKRMVISFFALSAADVTDYAWGMSCLLFFVEKCCFLSFFFKFVGVYLSSSISVFAGYKLLNPSGLFNAALRLPDWSLLPPQFSFLGTRLENLGTDVCTHT